MRMGKKRREKKHEREAEEERQGRRRGIDMVGNVGTRDREDEGETNKKGRKEEGIRVDWKDKH